MFSSLKRRYKRLPAKDRVQLIVLVSCILVSGYGFSAAMLWQQMFEAEKLANRKANRIETRIGKIEAPKFERNVSENQLQKLEQQLAQSYLQVTELTTDFIDVNDAEKLQSLKLNISTLADDVKLNIEDFKLVAAAKKAGTEEISEYRDLRSQYYQRPYLALQGKGNFFALLQFLESLAKLEHIAVVQQLDVDYVGQGQLAITMKILV